MGSSNVRAGRRVALLRGINVGKAKRVSMADLKALVEELGYANARTLLNSGNVVFDAGRAKADPAARIEKALAVQLGIASRVTTLTATELEEVVEGNPLARAAGANPSRFLVAVLYDAADVKKLAPLERRPWGADRLALGRRWAYVDCAGGILESRLLQEVTRTLKDAVTTRNWGTILKLHALAGAP